MVLGLAIAGIGSLLGEGFIKADWLSLKVLIFALMVSCGIYIRLQLKPFVVAFGALMTKGSSPEVEATLTRALARCRPAVYLIWVGLVAAAALGLHLIQL